MHDRTSSLKQRHSGFNRRQLIAGALAGVGAVVTGPGWLATARAGNSARRGGATEIVTLGRTGIKATRLAQGTGYNGTARSSEHTRLGMKAFTKLVRHSLERGINFMDMADLYGSHQYVRRSLEGVPRDKYILLSKIWPREAFWNMPSGGAKEEVNRFCKEMNTDVIDICLIHCMTNGEWPKDHARVCDELDEMKEKGAVRAVGVSCHNLDAMKVAATLPWTDVILARINNVGKSAAMDASVEEVVPVIKQARANGKVVLGMKIFGAGALVSPEAKDASIKFVHDNNLVDAMTIGMLSPEQVDDTIERINKVYT
ncbi:MAG: aldo/keto reductase [Sedimentisphaerales bacterium]|nr:aldo/keto reductase [Sedimentisphaerales bacterium]